MYIIILLVYCSIPSFKHTCINSKLMVWYSLLFSYSTCSYSIDLFMQFPTILSCHFCSLKYLFHPDKIITRETLKQVTQPMTRPVHVPYVSTQQCIKYWTLVSVSV